MFNKYISTLLLSLLLLTACSNSGETVKENSKPYFDLKQFITQKATDLTNNQIKSNKTVTFEGESETKETQPNWKDEWKVFTDSDINKTAYIGKYQIDSSDYEVKYTALDEDLKTQELTILRNNNEVKKILVLNKTKNVLYQSTEELIFDVATKQYGIIRNQKIIFGDSKVVSIKGRY